jgi:TonB-linked SusC/RagA family outer membrane protein
MNKYEPKKQNKNAMKRYILFGLSLLMAFPLSISAQDEDFDDEQETVVKKKVVKVKQYETRTIKGKVADAATGKPISGALVQTADFRGYSTLTEDDGTYELKLPLLATSVLISAPDYNMVRLGVQDGEQQLPTLLFAATFDAEYDKDINVRSDYSSTDFKYSTAINVKEELQKQLGAFAHVTGHNGTPGSGGAIFMNGLNSLHVNAQPLIVIDGVPIDQQYNRELLHQGLFNDILSNLSMNDVQKVTVMRNGTALYGAKGANGVILIETKRSKSMATRITATAAMGVTMKPQFIKMMDENQYRLYVSDMLRTTGTKLSDFQFLDETNAYYYPMYHNNNTDWKEHVYQTALTQNYGINVEGGDDVANYNLAVNYMMGESTLKYNDLDRLNVRFNTDINITDKLFTRFDASYSNQTRDIRNDGAPMSYDEGTPTSPAFLAYVKSPFLNPYSYGYTPQKGGLFSDSQWEINDESYLDQALSAYPSYNWRLANPAALNEYSEAENKNRFENSLLNIAVMPRYSFNQNLSLQEHFSYTLANTSEMFYIPLNGVPSYYVASVGDSRENEVRAMSSKQNSIYSDTRLAWNNRYDAHSISVFGGIRMQWESYKESSALGYNTGSDKTPYLSGRLANAKNEGIGENWNSLAYYAQADYNYLGRYYLQGNLTVEGSSRFGKEAGLKMFGAGWGVFPGIQASWVISNEPWMARIASINYLRLTAGFDVSGNDDVAVNAARSYFRARQYLMEATSLAFDGIGNDEIQWETTRRFNIGLESNMIDNRLNLSVNYFRSTVDNMLTYQALGYLSGLEKNWSNGGKMQNEGFDVAASVKVLALKDWQWQVGASVGHYNNKVVELGDGEDELLTEVYGATLQTKVGQPANLFYGYRTDGVFAKAADATAADQYILGDNGIDHINFQAGDVKFVDLDQTHGGAGEINEYDRTVIGDPNPDIYGNIFTSVNWKRLKLDVRFNYSLGNDVYNYMRQQLESGSRFMNQTLAMTQRWQIEGQQTDMPRVTFQDPMGNSRFSDRWIEDGSYLRLKSVTLSYDLPLKSEFIQGVQFWIQGNNLLTFTKYLGSDPEFSATNAVLGQGIDVGQLAQGRSVVAGVKINL